MTIESFLACNQCGKTAAGKETRGWRHLDVMAYLYRKHARRQWFRNHPTEAGVSKDFCSVDCMTTFLTAYVELSNKVAKLLKAQKKQGKRKGCS